MQKDKKIIKKEIQWHSQLGQDKYVIEKILNGKKEGVFVEVGAHNGLDLSNTATLEKEFNWSGVCVEPSKQSARIISNRKKSLVFNYCACPLEFDNQLVRHREYSDMLISQTIFEDLYEPPHYAKELETQDGVFWDRMKKCKTLDSILDEAQLQKDIDYISIDTQGSEWLVMKDFKFNKWNVSVFSIAHDAYQEGDKLEKAKQISNLMRTNGYSRAFMFTLKHLDKENWSIRQGRKEQIEDLWVEKELYQKIKDNNEESSEVLD